MYRYFVTHFKTCHLKNLLYRFNGLSEEENQKIRFGPRRKRDAHAWFGQLKSTEKRMVFVLHVYYDVEVLDSIH